MCWCNSVVARVPILQIGSRPFDPDHRYHISPCSSTAESTYLVNRRSGGSTSLGLHMRVSVNGRLAVFQAARECSIHSIRTNASVVQWQNSYLPSMGLRIETGRSHQAPASGAVRGVLSPDYEGSNPSGCTIYVPVGRRSRLFGLISQILWVQLPGPAPSPVRLADRPLGFEPRNDRSIRSRGTNIVA